MGASSIKLSRGPPSVRDDQKVQKLRVKCLDNNPSHFAEMAFPPFLHFLVKEEDKGEVGLKGMGGGGTSSNDTKWSVPISWPVAHRGHFWLKLLLRLQKNGTFQPSEFQLSILCIFSEHRFEN